MAQESLASMRKREYAEATGKVPPQQQAPQVAGKTTAPPPAAVAKPRTLTASKGVPRVMPGEKWFTLEQLQKRPAECDTAKLELYLTDAEFIQIFNIDKPTFAKLPQFKQQAAKKALGIF